MQERSPASERYWLNKALFDLGDPAKRKAFAAQPKVYVDRYPINRAQRRAILEADWPTLLEQGALPILVFKYYMVQGLPYERFAAAAKGKIDG